jgi:hypothetical protein
LGGYGTFTGRDAYFVLDYEADYLPMDEQQELLAAQIAELGLFQFLCRPAVREGEVSPAVIPLTIAHLDRDEHGGYQFPNAERVARFRAALAVQTGIPAATLLRELDAVLPAERAVRVRTPSPQKDAAVPAQQSHPITRRVRLS